MAHIQSEHDILFNRAPRQEQWLLEHIAGLSSPLCPGISIDSNYSCTRLINPCHDIEERTFPTSARPDERHKFALGDRQVNWSKRLQQPSPITIDSSDTLHDKFWWVHLLPLLSIQMICKHTILQAATLNPRVAACNIV